MRVALLAVMAATAAVAQKPEFVNIPAGSFVMGCEPVEPCAKNLPKKTIAFEKPFEMMKHEATVAEFRAFVRATGYKTEAEKAGDKKTWQAPDFPLDDRQPVVFLSLNDANAFCSAVGARVPYEAEWEYAARAGTSTYHYWGEEIDGRYLWYFQNTDERPMPVGKKRPNAWGLYDVEGNAMEWVRAGGPHSSITKPEAGSVRGGSYASCPEPYAPVNGLRQRPIGLGPTFRLGENSNFRPTERRYDYGVRCAR